MRIAANILAFLLVAATLIPLVRWNNWWIRVFDYPRTQTAVLMLLAFLLYALAPGLTIFEKVLRLLLVFSLLFQAYRIRPFSRFFPAESRDTRRSDPPAEISILTANVMMQNRDAHQLLDMIRKLRPDLVLLAEPDAWWDRELRVLEAEYHHAVRHPRDNTYGMILYSKLPLIDPEIRFLVEPDVPSIRAAVRLRSGDTVLFYGLHPRPPRPAAGSTFERDTELLLVALEAKDSRMPVIVAGDLNDVAWSFTTRLFKRVSRLLDPRIGRGQYNTYHAKIPGLRFPVDHLFHSQHFGLRKIEREARFGSDHFPIFVTLTLLSNRDIKA